MWIASGVATVGVIFVGFMIWCLQVLVSWSHRETFDDLSYEELLNNGESDLPQRPRRKPKRHFQYKKPKTFKEKIFGASSSSADTGGTGQSFAF